MSQDCTANTELRNSQADHSFQQQNNSPSEKLQERIHQDLRIDHLQRDSPHIQQAAYRLPLLLSPATKGKNTYKQEYLPLARQEYPPLASKNDTFPGTSLCKTIFPCAATHLYTREHNVSNPIIILLLLLYSH